MKQEAAKLNEYTKEEWRDLLQHFFPALSDEEFDAKWAEFTDLKRKKALQ